MEVVGGNRLCERVLRPKSCAASHSAAAVRQRRNGLGEVLRVGIPAENLVPSREAMIETDVELVLLVGFIADPPKVVCRSSGRGLWIAAQQARSSGIKRKHRNHVARVGAVVRRSENHVLL